MIVPSIDLMDGQTVQLVQGRRKVLEAGDPRPLAERFGRVGEVAVVDLDAALGRGSNTEVIEELCRLAPCRVGGGIRDRDGALRWLDRGAAKVVLGTAAVPEVLEALPRDRVVAALDAWEGEVVVKGWTERTGRTVLEGMRELSGLAGAFLVTFVEGEGKEGGFPRDRIPALAEAAGASRLTIAGGITTAEEIAWLDAAGADAQVGMALYRGTLGLAEAFTAPLRSERPDGLWPTVVADDRGAALGLVWSSPESVRTAIDEGRGVYHSRSRGLWRKGASSGATQKLLRVGPDCDRDALRFTVVQGGTGFCHTGEWTCFGPAEGLRRLERTVKSRRRSAEPESLTGRLLSDPGFLRGKLVEEAGELGEAVAELGGVRGDEDGVGTRAGDATPKRDVAGAEMGDATPERDVAGAEMGGAMPMSDAAGAETGDAVPRPAADPRQVRVVEEAADVMYFLTVALESAGVSVADVERELDRRSMKVGRRAASAPKGAADG